MRNISIHSISRPSVNDCYDFDKNTQQNLCQWKKHQPVKKKKKILPVKRNILPVKKYKNSAREKKKCAWKKQKKVCVKNTFCPWKNPKNEKKRFSRALFFSRGKKITLSLMNKIYARWPRWTKWGKLKLNAIFFNYFTSST